MKTENNINYLAISFILVLALLFVISLLTYRQNKSLEETEKLVIHTYQVKILLEQFSSITKDAETGQRGFLLTKDSSYLKHYINSKFKIDSFYNKLYLLTTDNTEQQQNLKDLKMLITDRFKSLEERLKEHENSNALIKKDSAILNFLSGKHKMEDLQFQFNKMIDLESTLLIQHKKENNSKSTVFSWFSIFFLIFTTIIFLGSFHKINIDINLLKKLNEEKEERSAELIIANKEIVIEYIEKEKRAAELIIANKELAFQNKEKEKRAAELIIANKELAFQNDEKEKRADELTIANKELSAFTYIASHDLQEPLRKTQLFISRILDDKEQILSEKNMDYFKRMQQSSNRMQMLINDLLAYSKVNEPDKELVTINLNEVIDDLLTEMTLVQTIEETNTTIHYGSLPKIQGISFQLEQLFTNLITNAIKYSDPARPPVITIRSSLVEGKEVPNVKANPEINYNKITVTDNGIGFEQEYADKIFLLFQRLHDKQTYSGTGIGLTICKKITENHHGFITATSVPNQGSAFDLYIPEVA